MQTVMGGISEKFSDVQQREVGNYVQIISANSCQRRNFLFPTLSILPEDEGQYNKKGKSGRIS
jgi:hypothetical protein